ncbi:hypothetical protein [Prevotella sp.]|uniref:hypothetical protein n=1 Tax=Prevotella sp. TaxID=59823 RepID=UPI0030771270
MNNFLLRGLLSATVCLVAGSAFAQTTETSTLGVSNDVTLSLGEANKTFSKNGDIELYTLYTDGAITTDYIGAMSFDLPSKPGYAIKSATLRLVTERYKGSATLSIYSLGNNAVSDADTYNSQKANVEEARKNDPFITITPKGTHGKAAFDGGASSDINDWTNNIDLTLLAQKCGSGKLNLLLVNPSAKTKNDVVRFYSSDAKDMTNTKVEPNFTFKAEDLHPQLTVVYEEIKDAKQDVSLPTADTYVRKGNKDNNASKTTMEIRSSEDRATDFVGLMSFAMPAEVIYSNYAINKATLRLVSERAKGSRTINVYKYTSFEENTIYDNESTNIASARTADNLICSFEAVGQDASIAVDALKNEYKEINAWTNTLDFTDFVKGLDTNTFSILLDKPNNTAQTLFFTKDAKDFTNTKDETLSFSKDDLVPQLTVDYALASHTLQVTDAGAATLVLPYETEIPENVKAYTLAYTSGNKAVATELTGVIPANTPVLVNAQKGEYTFKATVKLTTKADKPVSGSLNGVWSEEVVPVGSYVLQNQSGTVAFYRVDAADFKVKANQAYLYAPEAAGAKMLNIDFGGEATAINGVEAEASNANTQVYTIDGKKANRNNLAKGKVYVTKGKTFILK